MRTLLIGLILLASAPSGEAAETWTCAHVSGDSSDLYRFEVSPPDVTSHIGSLTDLHFRIIRNDEAGLVATGSQSDVQSGETPILLGWTVVINKSTGGFVFGLLSPTENQSQAITPETLHGKCLKN
jgi:hypothetical protein